MKKLLFVLSLVVLAVNNSEYYEKLGVEKSATSKDIRKAFKKLALTMHPDKSKEPDAHEKFMELNKIYEVLKDDETRKKYDRWGEKGLEDGFNGGGRYESWSFFEEEFGLYDEDPEIHVFDAVELQAAMASDDVWMIKFYSERCSHCHDMAPAWREAAIQLEGIVKLGAISCRDYRQTCMNVGITGYPTVMVFEQGAQRYQIYHGGKYVRRGKKLPGQKTVENFVEFGVKSVSHRVREILGIVSLPNFIKKPCVYILSDSDGEFNYPKIPFEYQLSVGFGQDAFALKVDCTKDVLPDLCKRKSSTEETMFIFPPGVSPVDSPEKGIEQTAFIAKDVISKSLGLIKVPEIVDPKILDAIHNEKKIIALDFGTFSEEQKLILKRLPNYFVKNSHIFRKADPFAVVDCTDGLMRGTCQRIFGSKSNLLIFSGNGKGAFEVFHRDWSLMNIAEFAKEVLKTRMHTPSLSVLNELLSDGSEWILDFSAPWCPPCNNFLPQVRHASTVLADKNVKIAYIDCETYPGICNKYGIRSYPTLQFHGKDKSGKQVKETYTGDYDWRALVEFYEDIKSPSVVKLDAKMWREEIMHRPHEEIWFIDFAANWCRPCNRMFPEFKKAAKMLQGTVKFGHVECPENQALCESLGVRSYPTLKYLAPRNPGQPVSHPQNFPYQQRDEFSFIHFLSAELTRFSPVANASPQKNIFNYIQRVHQDGRHVMIDFYANWCRPCKQFEPYYQLASIKYKQNVLFAKVDCATSSHLCRGLNLEEYPTLMFFPIGGAQRSTIQMDFDIKLVQDQLDRLLEKAPKVAPKDEL
ncbi:unnamed protein product [Oikopleura dioica]|uniref:DnaJ homolog subfamily C member 10 n=1 Tax=Oikopleura dioica TaxID=34765 RepID=E4WSF7_OIKDI|nr:unnamed protein product [Oikopleura dioica]